MSSKLQVGVLGATGMVGQRFISLLAEHPWFNIKIVAASPRSAGRIYSEAVGERWAQNSPIPANIASLIVYDAAQVAEIASNVDLVFCAVDMPKADTARLEEDYARHETPVISNNSAHRNAADVPMMVPEVNWQHAEVINIQRRRLGVKRGFIAAKPNCSIQSYVPALHPLMSFGIDKVVVSTYQAISGAGKTFAAWPEMVDNVIPFIKGEEEKSEQEPLKIWGQIGASGIINATQPVISAQCIRVPVSDGHMATVFVQFKQKPNKEEIIKCWREFVGKPQQLQLPSAPVPFLTYFEDNARPQTKLDRDNGNGMGVTIGRLRDDAIFTYRFVCLSHNTLRGAAGGAVLTAELLKAQGYLEAK
ncbi:MAG: aspartate-semialdehyde dehydrogenase [Deltaproteobacteria bacterium]|nr:aspartate-semialdehyde dehydrogenase [Deltaproteobacteria bacterium]